jgi:hypothetical protein
MTIKTSIVTAAVTGLVAFAALAGTAAAGEGPPPPTGGAPAVPVLDTSATLALPKSARPGKSASVVLRLPGPAAAELSRERVTCAFVLGTTSLKGTAGVSGSSAICSVRLPRNAAGKLVRGAMRVVLSHVSIQRSFSFKVARI